ncbi:hypothetical protein MCANPG14_01133 [Mycoplasmopsis canis PG 14]|uniref:Lipoprotein n=1 Tax=Mycoplasmopsis canis TaxID=29555 RepID=A0A449AQA4_9BACT|nr:hypothetical protein [Mycoplasmopsis canis]AMD81288.1 hypothetical protein AXW82_01850 [Mycoplasmopsis canis PG 14]EIE40569.1 hypothetical protein MCANPG14_01133 [Mycoplasmopsis canis PG 14]VEU68738.1 Uncharacterised protein [Mycoplasmopsis canis]
MKKIKKHLLLSSLLSSSFGLTIVSCSPNQVQNNVENKESKEVTALKLDILNNFVNEISDKEKQKEYKKDIDSKKTAEELLSYRDSLINKYEKVILEKIKYAEFDKDVEGLLITNLKLLKKWENLNEFKITIKEKIAEEISYIKNDNFFLLLSNESKEQIDKMIRNLNKVSEKSLINNEIKNLLNKEKENEINLLKNNVKNIINTHIAEEKRSELLSELESKENKFTEIYVFENKVLNSLIRLKKDTELTFQLNFLQSRNPITANEYKLKVINSNESNFNSIKNELLTEVRKYKPDRPSNYWIFAQKDPYPSTIVNSETTSENKSNPVNVLQFRGQNNFVKISSKAPETLSTYKLTNEENELKFKFRELRREVISSFFKLQTHPGTNQEEYLFNQKVNVSDEAIKKMISILLYTIDKVIIEGYFFQDVYENIEGSNSGFNPNEVFRSYKNLYERIK